MGTISFTYTVGSAGFTTEVDMPNDWYDMDEDAQKDYLMDAARQEIDDDLNVKDIEVSDDEEE